MSNVVINPADFETRLKEAYASKDQMVRDTDDGLRYLVPEADNPGERTVENKLSRKSLFGIAGALLPAGPGLPVPAAGPPVLQLRHVGKEQAALGVLRRGAALCQLHGPRVSRHALRRRRRRLRRRRSRSWRRATATGSRSGASASSRCRNPSRSTSGTPSARTSRRPSLLSAQYDYYKRDQDTGIEFITPVSTFTYGVGLKLNWNEDGYNIAALGGYYSRAKWEAWGDPLTSGYDPSSEELLEVLGGRVQGLLLRPVPKAPRSRSPTSAARTSTAFPSGTSARSRRTA